MIDTHTHIQFKQFDTTRTTLIATMRERNISAIVVGIDEKTSQGAIHLAVEHDILYATVGIHPLDKGEVSDIEEIAQNKKVVAIGECGLDYTRTDDITTTKKQQKLLFEKHIALAQTLQLPVVVHLRTHPHHINTPFDAHLDCADIIQSYYKQSNSPHFHLHFYGDNRYTKTFLECGATFSFAGTLTFVNEHKETAEYIPIEQIMIETDAPFCPPQQNKKRPNTPLNVIYSNEALAHIKNISCEECEEITTKNAKRVFNI